MKKCSLALFFAGLLIVSPVEAQQTKDILINAGKAVFSDMEERIIRDVMKRVGLPQPSSETINEEDDDDQGKNSKKGKKNKKDKSKGKGKNKGMPPGLAKKSQLPKGLAKRDTLPKGLSKRDLPRDVTDQLPPPPPGTERVIVDNDVLLVDKGTQIVLDILKDVIRTP